MEEELEVLSKNELRNIQNKNLRREHKLALIAYKGGKCERCGYDKCIDALEFHHVNPNEKSFDIAQKILMNEEALKKEADKCILVCSNCHRKIHYDLVQEKKRLNKIEEEENIRKWNDTHDIKFHSERIMDFLTKEILEEDESEGISIKEAARRHGVSEPHYKRLRRMNGLTEEAECKLKDVTVKEVLDAFKELGSFLAVGRKFQVSDKAIAKFLKRNGLPYGKKGVMDYIKDLKC